MGIMVIDDITEVINLYFTCFSVNSRHWPNDTATSGFILVEIFFFAPLVMLPHSCCSI